MFVSAIFKSPYLTDYRYLERKNCAAKSNNNSQVPINNYYKLPVTFRGYTPISSELKLMQDFKEQNLGYIDFIENTNATPQEVSGFLNNAMNNDYTRKSFFDEITNKPAKSGEIVKTLVKKLGGKIGFLRWYLGKDGYVRNYERYLKDRYRNATSISELIKIQPNWGYWALERKQCDLNGYHTEEEQNIKMRKQEANFTFGELPSGFDDKYTFSSLVKRIEIEGWIDYGRKFNAYVYGDTFQVEHLPGGDLSAKNIYKITVKGKNYILKTDRFHPENNVIESTGGYDKRSLKEGRLLKGDSVYLDACIDYYLQQHGSSKNAALLYYDFNSNASLYEYVDANEIKGVESLGLIDQLEANSKFKEINKLGIYLNDIGMDFNCYQDKNGNIRLVDVGHAEYMDILKPGGNLLTFETSNLCGFSLKNTLAGLNLEMLSNLTNGDETPQEEPLNETSSLANDNLQPQVSTVIAASSGVVSENKHSSLNLPDVSGVDKASYIQSELAKADYSFLNLYEFAKNKDKLRKNLKWRIYALEENNKKLDSDPSEEIEEIEKRFELLEYYKKSLLARYRHLLDDNKEVIRDILRAMKREMKSIYEKAIEYNEPLDKEDESKMYGYKYFYSVLKQGDDAC